MEERPWNYWTQASSDAFRRILETGSVEVLPLKRPCLIASPEFMIGAVVSALLLWATLIDVLLPLS
jgi:hypothetical protein